MTTVTQPTIPFVDTLSWIETSKHKHVSLRTIIQNLESSEFQKVKNRRNDHASLMRKVDSNNSSKHSSQYIVNLMNHSVNWDSSTTTSTSGKPTLLSSLLSLTKERMLASPKSALSLSSTSATTTTRKLKSRLLSLAKRTISMKSSTSLSSTSNVMERDLPTNSTALVNKYIDEGLMISNHSTIISRIEQGQPINIFCMDGGGSKGNK